MREILFKAKRIDNGEWVEGELVRRKSYGTDDVIEAHIIIDAYEQSNFRNFGWQPVLISPLAIDKYDEGCYRVNPGTICQYTGLTDENGCKIWENDIVEFEDTGEEGYEYKDGFDFTNRAKVEFAEARWSLTDFISTNSSVVDEMYNHVEFMDFWQNCEVVGNIFDNADLLGE